MTETRSVYCLFCEDLREELDGKISIMGVYAKNLIVDAPFPLILPRLAIALWILSDIDDKPEKVVVRLLLPPNDTEAVKMELAVTHGVTHTGDATKYRIFAVIPIQNLVLPGEGNIDVWVDSGMGSSRAGRLVASSKARQDQVELA